MAKPNYAYEKRQRDLAKKQKKLEKQQHKAAALNGERSPAAAPSADAPATAQPLQGAPDA